MRQRAVLIVLAVVVCLGVLGTLFYLKSQSPQSGAPVGLASPEATPAATPLADGQAQTPADPQASPTPGAVTPSAPGEQGTAPVDLTTDASGLSKTTAVIETTHGKIKFKFYPKDAPATVNRIIELINQGFYNGLTFHRVEPGFVIQGGDPKGDGTGGSGQRLKAEFNERRHVEGTVAMARARDPDSADSQFYISLGTHPHLDRAYTVFGKVVEGMEAAKQVQVGDKMLKVYLE